MGTRKRSRRELEVFCPGKLFKVSRMSTVELKPLARVSAPQFIAGEIGTSHNN